jgi:hypothetical protein
MRITEHTDKAERDAERQLARMVTRHAVLMALAPAGVSRRIVAIRVALHETMIEQTARTLRNTKWILATRRTRARRLNIEHMLYPQGTRP